MKRILPVLRWPGGKSRHLKTLLPMILPHETYVEVFAGGLAVLLAKEKSSREVINDTNEDLVCFYRNARFHLPALLDELDGLNARAEFDRARDSLPATEIQRAARWFLLNAMSWGGKGENFGLGSAAVSRQGKLDRIKALSARLDRVVVEKLDYRKCLKAYDRVNTFFFIDPPYLNCDPGAYEGWNVEQMQELAAAILKLKGQWVLTVDDSPENREIFTEHELLGTVIRNQLNNCRKGEVKEMRELIIRPLRRPEA
ncbi:MAG: DNA adenine methylase [Chthoniobacterales bacterium]